MYDAAGERVGDRMLTIPTSVGANLGYQFTPFNKVTVRCTLRHDAFFHARD